VGSERRRHSPTRVDRCRDWQGQAVARESTGARGACDRDGKLRGEQIEARGRFLDPADGGLVTKLIRDKYGLWVPVVESVYWLGRVVKRQPRPEPVFIEIVDA
jgi:hypothetical protein